MIESILGSRTKVRILRMMVLKDRDYTLKEIVDELGLSFGNAHPAMLRLLDARILTGTKVGRSTLYSLNRSHVLYQPLKGMFTRERDAYRDIAHETISGLDKRGLNSAILFGSVARGDNLTPGDIDILLISEPRTDYQFSREFVTGIEERYDVHISIMTLSQDEVKKRLGAYDTFIITLVDEGIVLYGDVEWLNR